MAFTQKYAIISPIDAIHEGQIFNSSNWPLHTTLADTFAIDSIDNDLLVRLRSITKNRTVVITGRADSYFGKQNETRVMLLEPSRELVNLHSDIIDLLIEKGAVFNDLQYTKAGFIGHVTQQTHRTMQINDTVQLSSVALIDMFPDENPYRRRVIELINFNEV
jgi:2'-5' RNA ligase